MPANVVDMKLRQAQEIIEELLKPVVIYAILIFSIFIFPGRELMKIIADGSFAHLCFETLFFFVNTLFISSCLFLDGKSKYHDTT